MYFYKLEYINTALRVLLRAAIKGGALPLNSGSGTTALVVLDV